MVGGFTELREMTEEVEALAVSLKREIEQAVGGGPFETFKPTGFKSQVVNGTNYLVTIEVGTEKRVVEAKIHKPLPHKATGPSLMTATWQQ